MKMNKIKRVKKVTKVAECILLTPNCKKALKNGAEAMSAQIGVVVSKNDFAEASIKEKYQTVDPDGFKKLFKQ
jgi:ribosome biogenesis protein Tsr3